MPSQQRPRRYLARPWFLVLRPVLRYSVTRDAFVLRGFGRSTGPVLRLDRRARRQTSYGGDERRRMHAA
jgi:hypothetical protein